jgi:hypothetical protein
MCIACANGTYRTKIVRFGVRVHSKKTKHKVRVWLFAAVASRQIQVISKGGRTGSCCKQHHQAELALLSFGEQELG